MVYDAIIVGGGASGFLCAISALQNKKKVLILEKSEKPLKKVAVSGGGRCNFSNLSLSYENYNNKFCEYALSKFNNSDFIKLLNKHNIKYVKKNETQLFSEKGSEAVIGALEKETLNADKLYGIEIKKINKNKYFEIETNAGNFSAEKLVIASGGMSFPQLGASDIGYKTAKQFGLKVVPVRPGLVAVNLDSKLMKELSNLQGIAIKSSVKCKNKYITDDILFTHFGLSGPAILQTSLNWTNGDELTINFCPKIDFEELLKERRETSKGLKMCSILNKYFPTTLAEFFIGGDDRFVSEISNKTILRIAGKINKWKVVPTGTRGFKSAEITIGGVDVNEINPKTMESIKIDGLFFVGEVLDVAGQLGGYNLQWAWSSGYLAGKEI